MRPLKLVVAIGRQDQSGDPLDAPADQPQHVERCLVGPVQVLQDDDRGQAPGQRRGQSRDHVAGRALEIRTHGLRDIDERPQRAGGEERVAGSPQDPVSLFHESPQQRGLADSRLAADQDQPPRPLFADKGEEPVEGGQLIRALQ